MPINDNFKIKSTRLQVMAIEPMIMAMHLLQQANELNEAPTDPNSVYTYNSKKYGQPKFRIKSIAGLGQETDAFWFEKDEKTEKITLQCIIEVFREEADVYPLTIRNPKINLEFEAGGRRIQKLLTITQSPIMDAVNIMQELHAETEVKWDEIKDLLITLKDSTKMAAFQLVITSEVWWQLSANAPKPDPVINIPFFINPAILSSAVATAMVQTVPAQPKPMSPSSLSVRDHRVQGHVKGANPVAPPAPKANEPQKIDLRHTVILNYSKENTSVFGQLSSEFEVKGLNWAVVNIEKEGEKYTFAYRPTSQPDVFFFLPQVFRIKAKEQSGEPKLSITMVAGDDPNKPEMYRINIGITLVPYYNPKAKKDLYKELDKVSKGTIKYCDLRLDGYKSAEFRLREAFAGDNAVLRGKIKESIASIDPVNGFTLTVDCSLESFDFFKREITEGQIFGDIIFELISENEAEEKTTFQPIPVELNVRKLADIPVEIEPIIERKEQSVDIKGFNINNIYNFPLTVGGVELMLLSEINDKVYDAEYDVAVYKTWPVTINQQQKEEVFLKDVEATVIKDRFWTQLVCEPYSIANSTPPDEVLARVIDYATGDPQIWRLEISCPLFERWNDLNPDVVAPFKQVHQVTVEVKNEENDVFSVKLDINNPVATIEMARSITQILKTQQLSSRKYQYRVGTVYVIDPTHWSEWLNPESTAGNYLSIVPQKLAI